ncbi:MAG: serine/threonine protein kinase, partial [Anaerolineae bacterium]|nr:serine/threonine protein kinase [Anaerolineae bacterium]
DPEERLKAVQRFEIEARILATLKHQGIPDIYAYFIEEGRNYLVMEYIEGPDLAEGLTRDKDGQMVKGRPYKVQDVIRYAIQICEVLVYLEQHQPPVIHNDIKPANIIIDENTGRAVLVDFGTAKTRYSQQSAGQPGLQKSSVYGTVGFAAQELYDGKAEPRSDVYALAATAYHMLTDDDPRHHPFQFPKMETIPLDLRQVLSQALQDKVEDRLSASEFSGRLQALSNGNVQSLPPLTFPDGDKATLREDMIQLCIKHWDYASAILYDGSLTRWLSDVLYDSAAARAAQEAVTRYADDPNAGLEYLIRSLDAKAMPAPQLEVMTGRLRYDRVTEQDGSQQIQIQNSGGGYLYGTVKSSAEWVEVKGKVACAPGQTQTLPVVIHTQDLTPGQAYQAKVQVQASGAQSAVIPIEVKVPPAVVDVTPAQVELVIPSGNEPSAKLSVFNVVNRGQVRAECWIEGKPEWLALSSEHLVCLPGQKKVVQLMVGQPEKLPARNKESTVELVVRVKGAPSKRVQIVARPQRKRGETFKTVVTLGFAVLVLLASIGFVLFILPGLSLF